MPVLHHAGSLISIGLFSNHATICDARGGVRDQPRGNNGAVRRFATSRSLLSARSHRCGWRWARSTARVTRG